MREHGGTAITSDLRRDGVDHALDVTSEADWARVIDAIERGARRLDGLVNAAGINLAAYNASKGGVRLHTKSVALHGARQKPAVRCNSVHPSFIEGPMADGMIAQFRDPVRARERLSASVPLGRFGTPAEVAELCLYLLGDEYAFVTGAEFVLDGGLTAQ